MIKKLLKPIALMACALPVAGMAFEKGDIVMRGGFVNVAPDESSSNVVVGGSDLGFGLNVDNNTQLMLSGAYFLTDNLNIEVLAATPFSHEVSFAIDNPLGTGNTLGDLKHLPPTVTLNYYIPLGSDTFKPYIGAGVNYTVFFDEEFTSANDSIGLSNLSLEDSFGLAAQAGFDYMLTDKMALNAAFRWIDIDTKASFNLNGVGGVVDDIQIDPLVYSLGISYKF